MIETVVKLERGRLAVGGSKAVQQRRLSRGGVADQADRGVAALPYRVANAPALSLSPGLALQPEDRELRLEPPDVQLRRLVVRGVADLVLDRDDLFFQGGHVDRGELRLLGA